MRRMTILCAAFGAAFGALALADEGSSNNASPERVARLIQQLGSARFAEREAASRSLDALGDAATAALQAAAASNDAETRRRASELLQRIGQRSIAAKILKPTKIPLDFKDAPLDAAVKALANATGLPIELPQPARFAGRKVTIKSEPLPVWEAVELFCRKADLHEWDGATPLPGAPQTQTTFAGQAGNVIIGGGAPGAVFIGGRPGRPSTGWDAKVLLYDGPGPVITSCHAGAVRLRALPAGTPFPMTIMGDEVLLPLQISAEPRLQFAGALSLRIEKAIDELGKAHEAAGVVVPISGAEEMTFIPLPNGAMMAQPMASRAGLAALKINRGDKTAKTLREISGEMTARVHVTEVLARLNGPLKSGMAADGVDGVGVKVTDLTTVNAGEIKLSINLSLPPEVQPIGPLAGNFGGRVAFQGGVVIQQQMVIGGKAAAAPLPAGTTEYNGLVVEDAQGRRWNAVSGYQESGQFGPQGVVTQLVVTFKAPAPDAEAARLIFSGARPAVISIPIAFRDVSLP
jgi:hypothetical protein